MKVCARDQKMLAARAKGRDYRSDAEVKHGLWLLAELRAGRVKEFEFEKPWPLYAARPELTATSEFRTLIGHHKVDFTVWLPDGRTEVHEIKAGQATQTEAWQLRRKIFEANYPWCRYRVFEFGMEKRKWFIQLEDQ